MNRLFSQLLFLPLACALVAQAAPPPAAREMRAIWIATVDNIDWPSAPGLPVAQQQAELIAILDTAARLRMNTIVLQVRPACDAFYDSRLEPWSEWLNGAQGQAPKPAWDPLQFALDQAHARGLELHAWFNPFRARVKNAQSKPAPNHVQLRPGWAVTYSSQLWLDPGVDAASRHSLAVIADVVQRYDIDGIHIDDYFYPYPEKAKDFPDHASYRRYQLTGGDLSLPDWRRRNVDRFVEQMYRQTKAAKPWVKVGISPFGIARPGVPKGIQAGIDQFAQLYADPVKWLQEGWLDYLAPQLYWPIEQKPQSFPVLLDWWCSQNSKQRLVCPGLIPSRLSKEQILAQLRVTRSSPAGGVIHFSARALQNNRQGLADALAAGPYSQPVLPPAWPWLDRKSPSSPRVELRRLDAAWCVQLPAQDDIALWAVYLHQRGAWKLANVLPGTTREHLIPSSADQGLEAVLVAGVDRCGNETRGEVLRIPLTVIR